MSLFLQDLHGGGAERVMLRLAAGIAERSHPVDLVLIRREGAFIDAIPPGVRPVVLNTKRTLNSVAALARYLRRERPAALLSALVHVNVGALLAATLARTRTRTIVTEHSQITRNFSANSSTTVRLAYRMVPWLYPRATRIVAVSAGVADDLAQFSGMAVDRINVVHNGIVTPDLHAKAVEPCDHPWFRPGEPPVILAAGRMVDVKDFAALIRAFALLRTRRDARLMILGEGELRPDLELLARTLGVADHVAMPGFFDNPYALMSRAAVFVQSSRWEGLPSVLVEAMACGTPVVATDCPGGTREILDDGRLGALVPLDDDQAMADAIGHTLDNPVPANAMASKVEQFTLERAVDTYLELALGRPGGQGLPERRR
ncbi:glycosyl transferase family 1 [Skermanella stibiiresistens SB22]|uniref:Glycosyl transferase family 1 n=1 Tax=Skermanella stibiiresistens SB22 TaxID=1385369 RepID=W9HC29_9PROT|nr:glycosyl transferase family 1 [Skermanella stibiiresistens SB22]